MQQIDGVNGSIVLGGTSDGDFALARFAPNGTLDDEFGVGGVVVLDVGGTDDEIFALAVGVDGKIVAAGVSGRLHSPGAVHVRRHSRPPRSARPAWSGRIWASSSRANAVYVLSDGRVLVAGEAGGNAVMLRYTALQAPTFTGLTASPNMGYQPLENVRLEAFVSTNGTTLVGVPLGPGWRRRRGCGDAFLAELV